MAEPTEPVVIAEQGGLVVAEHGGAVLIIDRGNGPTEIMTYLLVVITLVFGGFGAVWIVHTSTDAPSSVPATLGASLLLIGIATAVIAGFLIGARRRTRQRPLSTFTPVAVIDRTHRVYRDRFGRFVVPLDQVRFTRRMQLTSSSPKLVAVTPAGTHLLKRGNPFGGGIGRVDEVLNHIVDARPN
ncbi:Uncharacterised protein [Mycolicibacterium vanbaalenii]|uniref:PH domain-containing protein n=1 Tax=Mycolicibacterium vanbaalenii TaxID=110539 RepID=A0A5S9P092_MYCVN|nr:hypothetical protein [Mycolicibacterium vanbaalenii]CAA0096614.1 Uncharacterised protein [Mycolicibacterium vanbaalenii]